MRRFARNFWFGAMKNKNSAFTHLDRAGRATVLVVGTANAITFSVLALVAIVAWAVLAGMAGRLAPIDAGPGGHALGWLSALPLPGPIDGLVAYCLKPLLPGTANLTTFLTSMTMWFVMSLAMMLPPAAPLVRTYCEIADTARAAGKRVVHPLWLVSGFVLVWIVAAAGFASVGILVANYSIGNGSFGPAIAPVSTAALGLAGIYQFSRLKDICLVKCRNPFSTLFANWSFDRFMIVKLGAKQGIWCLGCCWALMLVMFAVGIMNLFWMALLTAFTVLEKSASGNTLSRFAGVILLVWALAVLLISY